MKDKLDMCERWSMYRRGMCIQMSGTSMCMVVANMRDRWDGNVRDSKEGMSENVFSMKVGISDWKVIQVEVDVVQVNHSGLE